MNAPSPAVLIVEDEKLIRRFVRASLEEEGCRVYEAGTCADGLLEAGANKPDLIVLDLGLPDGNGVDFIRDLRAWSDVPILVLSARSNEKDKIQALDVGADDYLTKPFGVGELRDRARQAYNQARQQQPGLTMAAFVESGGLDQVLDQRAATTASATTSAICTAFSAAPLRKLSATIQRLSPFSTEMSSRMRLTISRGNGRYSRIER